MPTPPTTITYILGLELTGGTVTFGLTGITYKFNTTRIYNELNNFSAVPVWYAFDSQTGTYTKVTTPGYVALIDSCSLSVGDQAVDLNFTPNLFVLDGNYSNAVYPNNNIQVIKHIGVIEDYLSENWGVTQNVITIPTWSELDTITSFVLEAGPKTVTISITLKGSINGGPYEYNTVQITQDVLNLNVDSEQLKTYIGQTYFGRKIYPYNADGTPNMEYFDGVNYD